MKKDNNIVGVDITVDKNKDVVEVTDEGINIIAENGVRIELPYDKAEIEKDNKKISFEKKGEAFVMKKERIKE